MFNCKYLTVLSLAFLQFACAPQLHIKYDLVTDDSIHVLQAAGPVTVEVEDPEITIADGTVIGFRSFGWLCASPNALMINAQFAKVRARRYSAVLREELVKSGYKIVAGGGAYRIKSLIPALKLDVCEGAANFIPTKSKRDAKARIRVNWTVIRTSDGLVVYDKFKDGRHDFFEYGPVFGSADKKRKSIPVTQYAFRQSVRRLLADSAFHTMGSSRLSQRRPAHNGSQKPAQPSSVASGALADSKRRTRAEYTGTKGDPKRKSGLEALQATAAAARTTKSGAFLQLPDGQLKQDELMALFTGLSVGTSDSETLYHDYDAAGRVEGEVRGVRSSREHGGYEDSGRWNVTKNNQLCFKWDNWYYGKNLCFKATKHGKTLLLVDTKNRINVEYEILN